MYNSNNKQNQKLRPQLGIKSLTAIKKHIDQPGVDSKTSVDLTNQQKVERTLSNITTLTNNENSTKNSTQTNLHKSVSYDSHPRSLNRRNNHLKHSRNSINENNTGSGLVRVFTRNKEVNHSNKLNTNRLSDSNFRNKALRQSRSDSTPTLLLNENQQQQQQQKTSTSSFSEKTLNANNHSDSTNAISINKKTDKLKNVLPSQQQQQAKSAPVKNKKKVGFFYRNIKKNL